MLVSAVNGPYVYAQRGRGMGHAFKGYGLLLSWVKVAETPRRYEDDDNST